MIILYGKKNCSKCDAGKAKLENVFKLDYEFIDMEEQPQDDWRKHGVAAAQALYEFLPDEDKLPLFSIDGALFTYTQAMKHLRNKQKRSKKD